MFQVPKFAKIQNLRFLIFMVIFWNQGKKLIKFALTQMYGTNIFLDWYQIWPFNPENSVRTCVYTHKKS